MSVTAEEEFAYLTRGPHEFRMDIQEWRDTFRRSSSRCPEHSHDTIQDFIKMSLVDSWIKVFNPVVASCKCCGYRGCVSNPTIGLY